MNRTQRRRAAKRKPSILEQRIADLEAERVELLGVVSANAVKMVKTQNKITVADRVK